MVEAALVTLCKQLKPLIEKWHPNDQVEAVEIIVAAWKTNNWGEEELTVAETQVSKAVEDKEDV